jgi:hypothetical protein
MNINGLEARGRYRHRTLPALWWAIEADRGNRRPAAITRILTHLELTAQPPARASAVRFDLFQAA